MLSKKQGKIQIAAVGDGYTEKSKILMQYAMKGKSKLYRPTSFDYYDTKVEINNEEILVRIADTSEEFLLTPYRRVSLIDSELVLLIFSLVDVESLEKAKTLYNEEIKLICPDRPYILVGTKSKLRDKLIENPDLERPSQKPIPNSVIKHIKNVIKPNAYFEIDIDDFQGIDELFEAAIKMAMIPLKTHKCYVY